MAEMGSLRDWITTIFLVSGGFFLFVASLGVLRLPDVIIRMHALTKGRGLSARGWCSSLRPRTSGIRPASQFRC